MMRFRCINLTYLLLLLSSVVSASYISPLQDCNAPLPQLSRYTVLDKGRNTLNGWSHIHSAQQEGEYQQLKLSDADYQITQDYYVADKSCAFTKVQNAILVVKLSDWTRQHSNGFETILDVQDLSFADVGYVLIDLKVNRIGTAIMDVEALHERYDDYLTNKEFTRFDGGQVNLGITLFEDGALDPTSESLNAEFFLSIDQNRYFDQWVRVILPLDDFHTYTEKNYNRLTKKMSDYKNTKISGFRINPENSSGLQLRNLLGEQWSPHIPETFKEMSISLRRIELLKRR